MPAPLLIAIISMFIAVTLYTVAVWSERFAGMLIVWHLLLFWGGFLFDTTGTTLMTGMAGALELNFHSITGALAIVLMFGHAIWASIVLLLKQEKAIANFHKLSMAVWIVWLIPFITGLAGAMLK